jgi:hypothetical protein
MSVTVTYHGGEPAINVKDDVLYAHAEPYASLIERVNAITDEDGSREGDMANVLYEGAAGQFWQDAKLLAEEYGYGEAYADGRSGGWLHLERPPVFEQEEAESEGYAPGGAAASHVRANLRRWAKFNEEIDLAITQARERYVELLEEYIADVKAEEAESAAMAARDILTQ